MITQSEITQKLAGIVDPEMNRSITALGFVPKVEVQNGLVTVHFTPDIRDCPIIDQLKAQMDRSIREFKEVSDVNIIVEEAVPSGLFEHKEVAEDTIDHLNHFKKVIGVFSGKSRAKKCLVSSFLAVYLRKAGYQVGLLDTDISARSICKMFFPVKPSPRFTPKAMLPAITSTGIKMMALSVHLPENHPTWDYHQPEVMSKMKEMTTRVFWGDLDYLIVDLPAGTSDAPRELLHTFKMDGAILVTSPHDLDGLVILKEARFVQNSGVKILGLVENQSKVDDTELEFADIVATPGHIAETASKLNVPVLGRVINHPEISIKCETGQVETCELPDFKQMAEWLIANA